VRFCSTGAGVVVTCPQLKRSKIFSNIQRRRTRSTQVRGVECNSGAQVNSCCGVGAPASGVLARERRGPGAFVILRSLWEEERLESMLRQASRLRPMACCCLPRKLLVEKGY